MPESAGELLGGKSMNEINKAAIEGVIKAHESIDIPIIKIDMPEITAYYFGQIIYYFQTTCAITGYLMGVNPFDQPGVEAYKNEIKKNLSR